MSRDYNYCIILSKTTTDLLLHFRARQLVTVFLNQLSVTSVSHNTNTTILRKTRENLGNLYVIL